MYTFLKQCSVAAAVLFLFFTGCTHHVTKSVSDRLDIDSLYREYKVTPANLAALSKCGAPPSVKIVNSESRTEDYLILRNMGHKVYVNPKEMIDSVLVYMQKGYEKSGIKVDGNSTKILQIKLVNLQSIAGGWSFEGRFKMELKIPEMKSIKIYEGMDNAAHAHNAPAYAIHAVVRDVINDTDVQNYILCK